MLLRNFRNCRATRLFNFRIHWLFLLPFSQIVRPNKNVSTFAFKPQIGESALKFKINLFFFPIFYCGWITSGIDFWTPICNVTKALATIHYVLCRICIPDTHTLMKIFSISIQLTIFEQWSVEMGGILVIFKNFS